MIEQYDPKMGGIKKATILLRAPCPRATMQKQDWITLGVSALLIIQFVRLINFKDAGIKRFNSWKKNSLAMLAHFACWF